MIFTYMKQNKILLINDTITNHGGAETYCLLQKDLLESYGYQTKLIGGDSGVGLNDSFLSRWYSFSYYKLVQEAIKEFSPDIVHVHNISRVVSPSVLSATAAMDIPIIQTVHDYHYICPKVWMVDDKDRIVTSHDSFYDCLFHHLPKKNIFYAASQAMKANMHKSLVKKYVNHFICPSRDLAKWYGTFDPNRVSYLPLFIPNNMTEFIRQPKTNTILFVGRLSKEKGVSILLQALQKVQKDIPTIKLQIIGDGPEKQSLITITNQLGLSNNVQFLNKLNHNEITTYYRQAAATIIPSSWIENCPMVALEAISAECPIIASRSGGLADLVQDTTTGYLFERNNITELAEKICMLLCDIKLQKKFSSNQKHVAQTLTKEKHMKELEQIYKMYL
jgi:glycosyltransferase involved in cell wall biosynthesis